MPDSDICHQGILTTEQVAAFLHCSVDTLRRIDRAQLPVYRVGKRNLYLLDEVRDYLRRHCRVAFPDVDRLVSEIENDLVSCESDGVRERSQTRRAS